MKMTSKIFAGIFAAAVMATAAVSVSAADYSDDPAYGEPATGNEVGATEAAAAVEAAKDKDTVEIKVENGADLSKQAIAELKKANKPVEIVADDYTVTISAAELAKIDGAVDLTIGVTDIAEDTTIAGNIELPKDAVMIVPAQKGEWGFEVSVTVKTTLTAANLYYIGEDGKVEDLGAVEIKDGEATIKLSHASSYVLSAEPIEGAADDGKGDGENKPTGVTLPIALVVLAGGSVAVSAIAAKKRK